MQKFWIQTIALVLVVFIALYLNFQTDLLGPMRPFSALETPQTKQLTINNTALSVDVADTPQKRTKGLSDRAFLSEGTGMLFVFPEEGKYRFWMKGMKFPIDFIFIKQGKVVDILENVSPPVGQTEDSQLPVYEPLTTIDMLLEVNAGFVANNNIKIGDEVKVNDSGNSL